MLEKGISRASVKHIICTGEMIENYPDDKPFPSGLFYGMQLLPMILPSKRYS